MCLVVIASYEFTLNYASNAASDLFCSLNLLWIMLSINETYV